jgi:predicted dehydrogenase
MQAPIRLGVIGLGRRWQRYRGALARLSDQVQVRAVCDPIGQRAEVIARQLHCDAAGGAMDLLERNDVEAVLLLDRLWYGLWPLERACRQGKPVFCAASLTKEGLFAEKLQALVRETSARVMMALTPWAAPSFTRLSEMLQERLGPVRLLLARAIFPTRSARIRGEQLLRSPIALSFFYACRALMGGPPLKKVTHLPEASSFASAAFELEGGRVAQVTLAAGPYQRRGYRIEVRAENGAAVATGPDCLHWSDSEGRHTHRFTLSSLDEYLLQRFIHVLRTNEPPRPSFDDAYQGLLWQRAALNARSE